MSNAMVEKLKDAGEDFEWYPTTSAMITTVGRKLRSIYRGSHFSVMDIGAGDGRVLAGVDNITREQGSNGTEPHSIISAKYAIEISPILLNALPDDVTIAGTNFMEQTLIDKKVDVIFCNPPYSQFEEWTRRILRECNCSHVFLIIPQRWKENALVMETVKRRGARHEVLETTDFFHAERSARAVVNIVHFDMTAKVTGYRENTNLETDPFDVWFEDYFKVTIPEKEEHGKESDYEKKCSGKKRIEALVHGRNQIESLAQLYRSDLDHLTANYRAVGELDPDILRELGVSVAGMKAGLKQKISGLKVLYWEELFSKLDSLTKRLTTDTRKSMLGQLQGHSQVDFTEGNIYAVVVWALKNCNKYIDSQLLALYLRMTSEENARVYKSNTHMLKDTWRYCRRHHQYGDVTAELPHHYTLDYRIVLADNYRAIVDANEWRGRNGLAEGAHEYIGDILTVANNLGFPTADSSYDRRWFSNQSQVFEYAKRDGTREVLCEFRAFKNGNIHMKANQEFMKALNVEAGRLNGWIKSPDEAVEELGIDRECAERAFMSNLKVAMPLMLEAGQ